MKPVSSVPASMLLQAPAPAQSAEGEFDLLGIVRIVRRRLGTILVVTGLVTLLALPGILGMKRVYHAETRLMISPPIAASLAPADVEGLSQIQMATELERLSSRDISLKVIDAFALDKLPEFNPVLAAEAEPETAVDRLLDRLPWRRKPLAADPAPAPADPTDSVLANYAQATSIAVAGPSGVIVVGFTSRDPVLAAQVANGVARVYFEDRERKRQSQVDGVRNWLNARIDEQRRRVETADAAADRYLADRGVDRGWLMQDGREAIATLTARHDAAVRAREALDDALADLGNQGPPPAGVGDLDIGPLAGLRADVQAKRRELTRLLGVYNPAHVEVTRARAALAEAEAAASDEVATLIATIRGRIADLRGQDGVIQASLDAARADLERQAEVRRGHEALTRVVDTEQQALDALVLQRRDLDSQAQLPGPEVEILAPAAVPLAPEGRGRMFFLVAAIVAGGMLALTVACLRELFDAGIRSHDQLEGVAGLTPVGMVPAAGGRRGTAPARTILAEPRGMFADAVRGTIVAMRRGNGGTLPQSLLVTSALPGEGKSTLAAALAIELASSGQGVLLIDCDLRRGRLGALFHVEGAAGLADYLDGDADAEAVVHHDRKTGVDVVAAGRLTSGALRRVDRVEGLVALGRERGQVVILDSPPVLATTEALLLAGLAERTLLAVRWGRTPKNALALAVERLASHNRRDLFCLLNRVDPRRHAQYGFRDAGLFTGALRKYYS